jgi:hypothetical protein
LWNILYKAILHSNENEHVIAIRNDMNNLTDVMLDYRKQKGKQLEPSTAFPFKVENKNQQKSIMLTVKTVVTAVPLGGGTQGHRNGDHVLLF